MNRKTIIVCSLIILTGLIIAGTYSLFQWNSSTEEETILKVTVQGADIIYDGEEDITGANLVPTRTKEEGIVKIVTLSLGNSTINVCADINLELTTLPSGLLHESFKYEIYKNDTLIGEGDFSDKYEGQTIKLATSHPVTSNVDTYKIYLWIDGENYNNPVSMQNQNFLFKINVNAVDGATCNPSRVVAKPNAPQIFDGMIPIKWDENNNIVKADARNSKDNVWYDYNAKEWANAVMVEENAIIDKLGNTHGQGIYTLTEENNISFDGVDDYLNLGYANYDFGNDVSVVIRMKFIEIPDDGTGAIINNYQNAGFGFYYSSVLNDICASIHNGTEYIRIYSNITVTNDTWYTLSLTYDGTTLKMYVDGDFQGEILESNSLLNSIYPIVIASNLNTNGYVEFSNIEVSDTYIYDDALTEEEVTTYFSGEITDYPKDNLLVEYDEFFESDIRSYYQNAEVGTKIKENDILAYWTWIPRYRYELFNVDFNAAVYDENGICTANCPQTINIEFEGTDTTKSNGDSNGEWLTHPAFTFGDTELSGFWVAKFEPSSDVLCTAADNSAAGTGCNLITLNPRILSGLKSWVGAQVSTFYSASQKFANTTYLTATGVAEVDAHMMKNMEWGAVAFLSHSIYGKNAEITINNNGSYFCTGGSCGNAYLTNAGQSTTGNVYGIYDTSGNAWEYVMGNLNSTNESSGLTLTGIDKKYIDIYGGDTVASSYLGDALGETAGWYGDYTNFVTSSSPWFCRGGYFGNGAKTGNFAFYSIPGASDVGVSFRPVLSAK